MAHLQSRAVKLGMMFIALLWLLQSTSAQAECPKCESIPPNDCKPTDTPPAEGGPPCSCTDSTMRGCVLKPCTSFEGIQLCEMQPGQSTNDTSMFHLYKYRCTPGTDQCESCTNPPPDCGVSSLLNPPAGGGPACSCVKTFNAAGCTLKPCVKSAVPFPDPCICQPGISSMICFNPKCPGNSKGGESGSTVTQSSPLFVVIIAMTSLSSFRGLGGK